MLVGNISQGSYRCAVPLLVFISCCLQLKLEIIKQNLVLNRQESRKGEGNVDNANFKELFRWFVEQYELAPEIASALLKEIMEILGNSENDLLQIDQNYEILTENLKREEML